MNEIDTCMISTRKERNVGIEVEFVIYDNSQVFGRDRLGNKQSLRVYLGSGIVLDQPICIEKHF